MAGLDWEALDAQEEARALGTAQQAAVVANFSSPRTSPPGASDIMPPQDMGSPARSPRGAGSALSPAHDGSPLADWGTPRRGADLGLGAEEGLAGPVRDAFFAGPEPEAHLDSASGGASGPRSTAAGTWVNDGSIWLVSPAKTDSTTLLAPDGLTPPDPAPGPQASQASSASFEIFTLPDHPAPTALP